MSGLVSIGCGCRPRDSEARHVSRAQRPRPGLLVPAGRPRAPRARDGAVSASGLGRCIMSAASFAALLQSFFTDRPLRQMRASPNTVAGYRDAFRLLLRYAADRHGRQPSDLAIDDLDPALVTDFLESLESERGNTPRTRNNRLAAIRSFFRHVAMNEPAYALHLSARPRHPSEASPEEDDRVPEPRGDRGARRHARHLQLDRAARQDHPARVRANRPPRLGADVLAKARRRPRRARSRPV